MGWTTTSYGMTFVSDRQFANPARDALNAAIAAGQAVYARPRGGRHTSPHHAVLASNGRYGAEIQRALCGKKPRAWYGATTAIGQYAAVCERCRVAAEREGIGLAPRFERAW